MWTGAPDKFMQQNIYQLSVHLVLECMSPIHCFSTHLLKGKHCSGKISPEIITVRNADSSLDVWQHPHSISSALNSRVYQKSWTDRLHYLVTQLAQITETASLFTAHKQTKRSLRSCHSHKLSQNGINLILGQRSNKVAMQCRKSTLKTHLRQQYHCRPSPYRMSAILCWQILLLLGRHKLTRGAQSQTDGNKHGGTLVGMSKQQAPFPQISIFRHKAVALRGSDFQETQQRWQELQS